MKRRNFLKAIGIGAIIAPAILSIKHETSAKEWAPIVIDGPIKDMAPIAGGRVVVITVKGDVYVLDKGSVERVVWNVEAEL